jgi:hypothetical protein
MGLVNGPDIDDQVFSRQSTNVYVAETVAARLDARVLDARTETGRTAFFLLDRGASRQR